MVDFSGECPAGQSVGTIKDADVECVLAPLSEIVADIKERGKHGKDVSRLDVTLVRLETAEDGVEQSLLPQGKKLRCERVGISKAG